MSSARVREQLECRTRLGVITPWPTKSLVLAAPREGGDVSERQGAWIRFVGTVPVKGCPFRSRSSDLRVTPPLAGHCHRGEPALG
jgi:hypothetical protein